MRKAAVSAATAGELAVEPIEAKHIERRRRVGDRPRDLAEPGRSELAVEQRFEKLHIHAAGRAQQHVGLHPSRDPSFAREQQGDRPPIAFRGINPR